MNETTRIQHIDAWRFVAIASVLVSHVIAYSHPWYRTHFIAIVWPLQKLGLFGVQIFFCISGYVICRGLVKEREQAGSVSIKAFYVRRFFRIVPPLCLFMTALAVLTLTEKISIPPQEFVRAGLFLCNLDRSSCGWFLGHTWSLAYEEQFYLVFPLLFIWSAAAGGRRVIALLTLIVMATSLIARVCAFEKVAEFALTFSYMLTGCVAALYWTEVKLVLGRMPFSVWMMLLVLTPTVACILPLSDQLRHAVMTLGGPPAVCAMVLGTPTDTPWIRKFFWNPTIAHLGKISFTIYLWQQLATANYPDVSPLFTLVALAVVFMLAACSYRFFELPLMRLGSSYARAAAVKSSSSSVIHKRSSVL